MDALCKAIHRVATLAELHTNSPPGSALGDSSTNASSTQATLDEIKYGLRVIALEQSRVRSMIHKSFLTVSHALDRDMKEEDKHTRCIVTHAKRIRSLGVAVQTALSKKETNH